MTGYGVVSLKSVIDEVGKERVRETLSSFSCPMNLDVETFLKDKAIEFSVQGITQAHLVLTSYKGAAVIVGYYALTMKSIVVQKSALSNSMVKRISKFARYNSDVKAYVLPTPLIAQLAKNFTNGLNKLITGDELLKLACDKVTETQLAIGGKTVYVECEDTPQIIEFYQRNGFCSFGKRSLDGDEKDLLSGDYLIQLLKYMK